MSILLKVIPAAFAFALMFLIPACSEEWKESADRADSMARARDYGSAIEAAQTALDLAIEARGPMDSTVASLLHQLGSYSYANGDYGEAAIYHERAVEIVESTFGPDHVELAEYLRKLAVAYKALDRYAEAESLVTKALTMWTGTFGPEDSMMAFGLTTLGDVYSDQMKYREAEAAHSEALAIAQKTIDPKGAVMAHLLNSLARVHSELGEASAAEPLFLEAISIRQELYGERDPDVAYTLDNLGSLCREQGRYAEAERLHKRALSILEEAVPGHPNTSVPMYNLANLYVDQGRYDEAENLYNRSLKIEEAAYGPMDDGVALTIEHLAILYSMQGRHEEAGPLHLRAFDIFEQVFGADHPLMAILLTNLGNFNQDQGNYGEAERLYGEAMKIARDALGDEHPLMVTVKVNLASLYSEVKRYSEAEALFLDAYETAIRTLGPKHPDMAYVSEAFGGYHRTRKSLRESMDLSLRAFDIRARHFEENGFVLSERDALKHSENLRPPMGIYLSSYFDSRTEDQDAREMAVDMVLRAKGRVSDLILERRNVIASAADPTISAMVADLRDTRLRLSDLYVQGPEDDDFTAYRTALDSLGRVANTIESDLAMESEAFRRMMDTRETSAGRLCPLLPESCVLLEYFKYDYLAYDPDSTISSYLLVALGSDGVLDMMDLGGASKLDSVVISYREHMLGVSSMDHMPLDEDCRKYESVAGELYRLVVGPIEKHLEGKRLLLVAPDGSLNLVSFAALVDSRGGYLVETIPVHYLSAARDLTWLDRGAEPGRGLLAFGDPDYDAGLEDGEAVSEAISDSGVRSVPLSTRGAVSSSLAASEAGPLPHTRSEIENISRYWEGHGVGLSRIFLGRDATEENFKTSAPGMLHIHAATHGFYREGHMNPRSTASQSALDIEFSGENPLLLSGLLLAGANVRPLLAAATGCEDGVLTAYEVSTIDLSRADMVVLSACETGLGKVYEGEGVYGLRRAFRMAGACTIVSALWPVSDEATTDVMAELYAESAVSIPERIRAMQLSRIARLRSEGLPDHPYTWAPFIAIGVWE